MAEWFVQYKGSKGYIAARMTGPDTCETYGDYQKKSKDCQPIVNALNDGVLKPKRRCKKYGKSERA